MTRLSASVLPRVEACPASAALPHVAFPAGADAERGRRLHAYVEETLRGRRLHALEQLPDELRGVADRFDPRKFVAGEPLMLEQAYAYNVHTDTARALPSDVPRGYGALGLYELPGTVDCVCNDNELPVVIDWKFGRTRVPATSLQLGAYALMVARFHGWSRVGVRVVQVDEEGEARVEQLELDDWQLAAIAARIVQLWEEVFDLRAQVERGLVPDVSPGPWCRYCPALAACPAVAGLARAVLGGEFARERGGLTPEGAGRWWAALEQLETLVGQARESLKDLAWQQQGLPLPGGARLEPAEVTYESIVAAEASPVLERWGLVGAGEVRLTKDALRTALAATGRADRTQLEQLLEELRQAGAVKRRVDVRFRTRKAAA